MSSEALYWTEYFKALGPTLIALFVAYIAYQQWRTNRANLREKLFERRYDIYVETDKFLSLALAVKPIEDWEIENFNEVLRNARFLFDKRIYEYLNDIKLFAIQIQAAENQKYTNYAGKLIAKKTDQFYTAQSALLEARNSLIDTFEPYLGFKSHK